MPRTCDDDAFGKQRPARKPIKARLLDTSDCPDHNDRWGANMSLHRIGLCTFERGTHGDLRRQRARLDHRDRRCSAKPMSVQRFCNGTNPGRAHIKADRASDLYEPDQGRVVDR